MPDNNPEKNPAFVELITSQYRQLAEKKAVSRHARICENYCF